MISFHFLNPKTPPLIFLVHITVYFRKFIYLYPLIVQEKMYLEKNFLIKNEDI